MLSYLEVESGFIELSKQPYNSQYKSWVSLPNGIQLRMLDVGVLQVKPTVESSQALIISCGVHGNETAPIEIVSHQISQIVKGVITPEVNVLYILGNPKSMVIGKRFMTINMNRLFAGAYKNYTINADNQYEIERAQQLEKYVSDFYIEYSLCAKRHLDLHTAIKPSFHKTFAIRPFNQKRTMNDGSRHLLKAMGMEAILQHNKTSTTFSYFSSENFDAEAYTLELGKVKPFGENNPKDFMLAINCLDSLVQDHEMVCFDLEELVEYKVVAEIIRHSDEFKFYVNESVENFTAFPQGYLIAEDYDYHYRVAFAQESVVFPNVDVPIGQRVAVMVTSINTQ